MSVEGPERFTGSYLCGSVAVPFDRELIRRRRVH